MFSRVDAGSFNRFLVSTGLLLVAAGMVLPLLVWRDSQWLLIPADSLEALTPLARDVIHQRQRLLQRVGDLVLIVSACSVSGGTALTVWGATRLFHRQRRDDEAADAQAGKVVHEYRLLTSDEQRRSAEAAAAEIEREQLPQGSETSERQDDVDSDRAVPLDTVEPGLVQRVQQVERMVFDRIERVTWGKYRLARHVLFREAFEIDGYLDPLTKSEPPVVIEVKYSKAQPQRRARDARHHLEKVLAVPDFVGLGARGWAVVVTDREVWPSTVEPKLGGPPIWITYVREGDLAYWNPQPVPWE